MNKIAVVVIGIGIIITIGGIIIISTGLEDAGRTAEDGVVHETGSRALSSMHLNDEVDREPHLYVHINSTYAGGKTGGYNERHGNNTWNLTAEDCDKVRDFTFRNYTENADLGNLFFSRCNYVEDIVGDDEWIVVGTICKKWEGNRTVGPGCPDGVYTWLIPYNGLDNNTNVMVYDIDMFGKALWEGFLALLSSFGVCCCGVVILLIGVILAFTMEDPQTAYSGNAQDSNLLSQDNTAIPKSSSGWDEKEDYIHREKEDDDVSDENESATEAKIEAKKDAERKRSGEYEIPPPPET